MKPYLSAAFAAAAFATAGCLGEGPTEPTLENADHRILFVGNSLTAANDLPAVVEKLARTMGLSVSQASILRPNFALSDHWIAGLEDEIRRLEPDIVVLQQGPSSLDASRDHLIHWTTVIAPVIRDAGGQPALFMVWPDRTRIEFFEDVRANYRAAADAVEGAFVPAGSAWVEAWARDSGLALYGPDGFHPSYLGTLVAAHAMVSVLFDVNPGAIPALDDGVDAGTLDLLREAVAAALD